MHLCALGWFCEGFFEENEGLHTDKKGVRDQRKNA